MSLFDPKNFDLLKKIWFMCGICLLINISKKKRII